MFTPQVTALVATDRIAERQRLAASARLAALARCCRPGTWARWTRRIVRRITTVGAAFHRHGRSGAACCSPA